MTDNQLEFHLPAPPVSGDTPLIPARMVNEFVYCPRLAYLMWTHSEWAETGDTVEGNRVHARVDRPSAPLPAPQALEAGEAPASDKIVSRSLTLSSTMLGVIAKLDIAEADDGVVTPVDYKRGKRPHVAQGVYEPERIQICLQGLLLEEHGYRVEEGAIYYAESRERVRIALDDDLRTAARSAVSELRLTVSQSRIPPPLKDSPKCPRCALVTVCLPDEIRSLSGSSLAPRTIAVPPDEALPLIVQSQHARIGKEGETLKITDEEKGEAQVRFIDISDVVLFGNVSITTPALAALLEREIPVTFHSHSGWFRGVAHGVGHRNVEIRTAQYRLSFDEAACLRFAKELVAAKITNQRTILRRNWRGSPEERQAALDRLGAARKSADGAATLAQLLGVEGDAAAVYFRAFAGLMKSPEDKQGAGELAPFRFEARNRRPPTDPVNAMLSLAYAMLTRHLTIALASVGLDPYRGFYHAPRYGRPALALDLMEPFRAIIADSVVLSAVNTGGVGPSADYGHLIVDECHHLSAASFELVARRAKGRYVLGLSATVTRKDGHHPIIFMQCGPVRHRVNARAQAAGRGIVHRAKTRSTLFQLPPPLVAADRPSMPAVYAAIAQDEPRNNLIFDDVLKALEAKRSPVVLTERRDHLEYLQKRFSRFVRNLVVLQGGMSAAERKVSETVLRVPDDQERLILATGRYIGEGFDDQRLDTLFLTMPISWKGTLAQYVGRLHRQHDRKTEVLVVDYVDEMVPVLARMAAKRRSGYRSLGYVVESASTINVS